MTSQPAPTGPVSVALMVDLCGSLMDSGHEYGARDSQEAGFLMDVDPSPFETEGASGACPPPSRVSESMAGGSGSGADLEKFITETAGWIADLSDNFELPTEMQMMLDTISG
jgi:hypothetical protein